MLRSTGFVTAALVAVIFPAFAYPIKETLHIQTGKDKAILDTILIWIDYERLPAIPPPNGGKWLEEDSAWLDEKLGQNFRYDHPFMAFRGTRAGYGSDQMYYKDTGHGQPEYFASVNFHFPPGDTNEQYRWEQVHMQPNGNVPDASGFNSDSPVLGQVWKYVDIIDGNLAEGQWAKLILREKGWTGDGEKPVVGEKPIVIPGKETLRVQVGGGNRKRLDTILIWTDYGKPPEIEHPQGAKWSDFEKDSVWTDALGLHIRYNHPFLASMGSRKGHGSDYMHVNDDPKMGAPQYSASVGFTFPGDTSVQIDWNPNHMRDMPDTHYPYNRTGFKSGLGQFGQFRMYVKGSGENLTQGQWAKLLIRENGWTGSGAGGTTALHPVKQAGQAKGWLVHLAPGTVLRAPPGATGLKVFDVQGRLHWESRNLREGAAVSLPRELPQGALRYYWQSERG